jgi:hypothetical protein
LPEGLGDLVPIAMALELQSPSALLTVLTTIARLGAHHTRVLAGERQAVVEVLAPRRVAHRVAPCVEGLIDVLTVSRKSRIGLS